MQFHKGSNDHNSFGGSPTEEAAATTKRKHTLAIRAVIILVSIEIER